MHNATPPGHGFDAFYGAALQAFITPKGALSLMQGVRDHLAQRIIPGIRIGRTSVQSSIGIGGGKAPELQNPLIHDSHGEPDRPREALAAGVLSPDGQW